MAQRQSISGFDTQFLSVGYIQKNAEYHQTHPFGTVLYEL